MSLDKPPPSRYRIVEKDGRLVVTDLQTGARNASADMPRLEDVSRGRMTPPSPAGEKPSATSPTPLANPFNDKTGRIAIVAVGAIALIGFLIVTQMWIVAVILLLIAPIREAILKEGKERLTRFIDGDRAANPRSGQAE